MKAIVTIMNGEAVADSRDIAAAFGKPHYNVLASIKDLIERRPDLALTFQGKITKVDTGKGATRDTPYYLMNRKGFVVLVGGFKGVKALAFRIAFYDAFEQMEQSLREMLAEEQAAMLTDVAARYLRKGSKVYVEGQLRTRKWQDQAGNDRYTTEIVLNGPRAVLTLLDRKEGAASGGGGGGSDIDDDHVPY